MPINAGGSSPVDPFKEFGKKEKKKKTTILVITMGYQNY
jgi:hypothetical protein